MRYSSVRWNASGGFCCRSAYLLRTSTSMLMGLPGAMVAAAGSAEKGGGKALGSMLRAVRQTPLTAMLSPVLRREVSAGAAMVMRVAPSVGVTARRVPVVSIKPVNINIRVQGVGGRV